MTSGRAAASVPLEARELAGAPPADFREPLASAPASGQPGGDAPPPAGAAVLSIVPVAVLWYEAAAVLGLARNSFYRETKKPGFPSPVWYGGRRRWVVAELREWALRQRTVPAGRRGEAGVSSIPDPAVAPRRFVKRRSA